MDGIRTNERGEELLAIGQMARLNAVSEKALRIYQKKGILEPAYTDGATGYRYYTLNQCALLDMVQQLQVLGFTLDQIADILRAKDVAYLRDRVREHVSEIERQAERLAMAHQVGGDLLRSCDAYLDKPPCGQPLLCTLPERHILEFPLESHETMPQDSGRCAMESWELNLRLIRRTIAQRGWPVSLFRNVGCTISCDNLACRRICYDGAFVMVTPAFGDDIYRMARTIPSATYLVEYLDSIITSDDRELETVEVVKLLDLCDTLGMEPAGDYLGEVIADGPAFLFEGREMLFRLCVPVRLKGRPDWQMPGQRDAMVRWRT